MHAVEAHLKEVWWLLLVRGVMLVIFGAVTVVWPAVTLLALASFLAIYLIVAGVVDIISGIRAHGRRSLWYATVALGLGEICLSVYLVKSGIVLATFIAAVGLALIIIGIMETVIAFESRELEHRRLIMIAGGIITVLAGFATLRYPVSSGLAFTWILGLWGLLWGSLQIAMCLAVRAHIRQATTKA